MFSAKELLKIKSDQAAMHFPNYDEPQVKLNEALLKEYPF